MHKVKTMTYREAFQILMDNSKISRHTREDIQEVLPEEGDFSEGQQAALEHHDNEIDSLRETIREVRDRVKDLEAEIQEADQEDE